MKLIFQSENLTIYNSIFEYIDSNMYAIVENDKALIIDPHRSDMLYDLLLENGVKDITILLTHEHLDHISGVKWLKDNFQTLLIATKETADYMADIKNMRPILISFILEERDRDKGTQMLKKFQQDYKPFTAQADITFDDTLTHKWNAHRLNFKATKGHSRGSCCIFLDDNIIFTGDSLMKIYPIITRFPRGNTKIYKTQTIPFFESLDKNLKVFPGHGEIFDLKDMFKDGKLNVELR